MDLIEIGWECGGRIQLAAVTGFHEEVMKLLVP
jgi:hypothetical protein